MRVYIHTLLLVLTQVAFAQLSIVPIEKSKSNKHGIQQKTRHFRINKNTLPFWDDFSITPDGMPDATRIWGEDSTRQWDLANSQGVFVNSTLAINPPSYKVITFDGLDANGQFYGGESGLTDQLVSDTLDLSAYEASDNVYLSFYWQAGGNVEAPDQGDSLRLQLYDQMDGWKTVWSVDGSDAPSNSLFYQDTVRFTSPYLTDAAVFRFQTYGDQDGPFDAWHLDWIYLNTDRAEDDFFYEDVSINTDPTALFGPFKSIPVNQMDFDSLLIQVSATAMSLNNEVNDLTDPEPDDTVGLNLDYTFEIVDIESASIVTSDVFSIGFLEKLKKFLNINPFIVDGEAIINYDSLSLSDLTRRDSVVLEYKVYVDSLDPQFLDGTHIDLLVNDTISIQNLLHDFYAYDDGTAEYAAGTNIVGGQIGVQFWVDVPDTLTHFDVYFPNIAPSSEGSSLTFRIFNNLTDVNPLRSQVIIIDTLNQFRRYAFDRPVVVSDTFFITYEQDVNEYIGVGFDRSNVEATRYIFENIEGQWARNDRLQGALMIRPVFQSGTELVLKEEKRLSHLSIYPNPTNGKLKVDGDYYKIEIRNMLGQLLIVQEKKAIHEFYTLDPGLYVMRIYTDSGVVAKKFLKR